MRYDLERTMTSQTSKEAIWSLVFMQPAGKFDVPGIGPWDRGHVLLSGYQCRRENASGFFPCVFHFVNDSIPAADEVGYTHEGTVQVGKHKV